MVGQDQWLITCDWGGIWIQLFLIEIVFRTGKLHSPGIVKWTCFCIASMFWNIVEKWNGRAEMKLDQAWSAVVCTVMWEIWTIVHKPKLPSHNGREPNNGKCCLVFAKQNSLHSTHLFPSLSMYIIIHCHVLSHPNHRQQCHSHHLTCTQDKSTWDNWESCCPDSSMAPGHYWDHGSIGA